MKRLVVTTALLALWVCAVPNAASKATIAKPPSAITQVPQPATATGPRTDLKGTKTLLIVPVSFTDYPYGDVKLTQNIVFGVTRNFQPFNFRQYLHDVSRTHLLLSDGFQGTGAHPPPNIVKLGGMPPACDPKAIIKATQDALAASKTDTDRFDYVLIDVSSTIKACTGKDYAAPSEKWMVSMGLSKVETLAYLFGRAAGFADAKTVGNCAVTQGKWRLNDQCATSSAMDWSDPMSPGHKGMYPVSYQLYAGWLKDTDNPIVAGADLDRSLPLARIWETRSKKTGGKAPPAEAPVGYRIARKDGSFLQIEYRRPYEVFEEWNPTAALAKGVTIRITRVQARSIASAIVDPANAGSGPVQTSLLAGQSLSDDLSGKTITVESVDANVAKIHIKSISDVSAAPR
ncbi:hypothetical protein PCA20602_02252 [Pandoraea capi]|uniref:Uncharacterized protein n=2 Tax=Pandoraea capi TaxID=2508286 RepID=A0ABY6VYF9_9BURK|nr:hypothetical protein PCA20602_02252 [Pandoraea capi]